MINSMCWVWECYQEVNVIWKYNYTKTLLKRQNSPRLKHLTVLIWMNKKMWPRKERAGQALESQKRGECQRHGCRCPASQCPRERTHKLENLHVPLARLLPSQHGCLPLTKLLPMNVPFLPGITLDLMPCWPSILPRVIWFFMTAQCAGHADMSIPVHVRDSSIFSCRLINWHFSFRH